MFELPEQLPATVEELSALLSTVLPQINLIRARRDAGEDLSADDVTNLRTLLDARDALQTEIGNVETADREHREELAALLARADGPEAESETDDAESEAEGSEAETEQTDEAEAEQAQEEERETVNASGGPPARQTDGRPVNFSGMGNAQVPENPAGPGWQMRAGAPGYIAGPVGFAQLAAAVDGIHKGSRKARGVNGVSRGEHTAQVLAELRRDLPLINDPHALIAEVERVTTTVPTQLGGTERVPVTANSLVAAGGWCAPSEVLYDFCDVPNATDLVSVPEITINRGGVRWPSEPDMTAIFEDFEFFFTESELEADPPPEKQCIEIPCPDEFEEMRLNVVGYCVSAGILQTQGWPELIEWFMQQLTAEHLRAISRRTILDMVNDSTLVEFDDATLIGAAGAILNSLDLLATNIRLNRGLPRDAVIEGVAPSWLPAVMRADWAYRGEDPANATLTDAQILQMLAARNIALQFVGDWQTRDTDLPGKLTTVRWPGHIDVLMYPAGTWFRAMQNVIEIGIMYPKEQLVLNRYTRMFTEDAIAVGRRCHPSLLARIPLQVDGAIGARKSLTYSDTAGGPGGTFGSLYGAPQPGGPASGVQTKTLTATSVTAGTFKLSVTSVQGTQKTGTLNFDDTAAEIDAALAALPGYTNSDLKATGGPLPGTAVKIVSPTDVAVTVTDTAGVTGGTIAIS